MPDSFCLLCVRTARCQYPCLPFLFSPHCHHDNLLTPAQQHTANTSLPYPPPTRSFSSPAPRPPPHLSVLYTLYLHLLSPVTPSLALSPSLAFSSSRVMSTCYPYLKELLLPDCHLCGNSICYLRSFISFTSVLYSLLPADCLSLLISV